jgi:hypothetical protein
MRYGCYITNLKRVGPGLGEYIFDKEELDDWKNANTWRTFLFFAFFWKVLKNIM